MTQQPIDNIEDLPEVTVENMITSALVDTVTHAPCNTSKRGRAYILTWNNYKEEDVKYIEQYTINCDKYGWQEEVGKEGTPHLQIALYYKNARTFDSVKKDFPKCHIENAKSLQAILKYCTKEDTRVGKPHTNAVKDPLEGRTPRPFQQKIIDLISEEPDDRSIHWYVDTKGGIGKTSLAKHLCLKYPNKILYVTGKAADIKYGITSFIDAGNDLRACILDFTRSTENYISYEAIESIKNGIFYNTKFESKMVIYNSPHVICLANFPPDREKLSADRWVITNLDSELSTDT